jgi:hypothetical protein
MDEETWLGGLDEIKINVRHFIATDTVCFGWEKFFNFFWFPRISPITKNVSEFYLAFLEMTK